ncbi:MAG: ABC transporter substrate-binding protein [Rhodobacteraceae bacterium]|nr:ABC transporter substrate-binding protein [Paracoccaceae bacterium]
MPFLRRVLLSLLMCLAARSAAAETTLNVAVVGLPRVQGHPYAVSNLPAIYVFTAIYDALTFVDNDGSLKPWLATSWTQTGDLTWEFTLRPNVMFSNGEPLDAEAVVASIDYLTSPAARSDTSAAELSSIVGARVLGPLTVEITTGSPNPILPREVSALRVIAPRHWAAVGPGGYARDPVGTGPFQVERWTAARVDLKAYRQSWRPPKLDRLTIRALPEMTARVQGLISGQIDVALALRVEDKDVIEAAGHRFQADPGTGVFVIALNAERDERLRDVRVREALNLAVDRERISQVMLGGLVHPASQFTPPNANGYDPMLKPYPYDPDRARAMLTEAGYPDGFSFVFEGVMGGAVSDSALFQQIASDLAKVGVTMEIRPIMLSQLSANMHSPSGWTGSAFGVDYGTAPSLDSLRALKQHSCLHIYKWFCDAEGFPVLEAALAAHTEDERVSLTKQVFRRYYDLYPAILLWDIVYFEGVRKEVGDVPAVGSWIVYDQIEKKQ